MGFFFEVLAGRPFLQPAQDGESDAPTSARHLISNRAAKRDKLTHLVEAVVRSCKGLKGLGFLEQLAHETQGIDAPKNRSFPNPTEHICPSELTSPPSLSLSQLTGGLDQKGIHSDSLTWLDVDGMVPIELANRSCPTSNISTPELSPWFGGLPHWKTHPYIFPRLPTINLMGFTESTKDFTLQHPGQHFF